MECSMSATKKSDKRSSLANLPESAKAKKDKKAPRLFVSFWHICLENLPEGTFLHRRITAGEAKRCIDAAREEKRLLGVTKDDLLAPYREEERRDHDALRRALAKHFEIVLSFRDFTSNFEADGDRCFSVNPLNCISLTGRDRLLVVTCCYTLKKNTTRNPFGFKMTPETVEFHQFESSIPGRAKRRDSGGSSTGKIGDRKIRLQASVRHGNNPTF